MKNILSRAGEINREFLAAMIPLCVFLLLAGREIVRGRFSAETAAVILAPGSGEEVLPDQAREILALVRENHLRDYRLSSHLQKDIYIQHRVTEGVWLDARPAADSRYLFADRAELDGYKQAVILGVKAHVALLYTD